MSRFRQLAAAALALVVLTAPAAFSAPAGAAPQSDDALSKVIVALDGDLTADMSAALERVGVVRGIELRSIDAVAATLPAEAVADVAALPGVRAVVPQRKLKLNLYRSKEQINALGVDKPEQFQHQGETYTRPGVTGKGVTVGIIDSGIFAEHPGFSGRVVQGLNFELSELRDEGVVDVEQWDQYAESTGATALQDEVGHGTHVAGTVGGDGSGAVGDQNLAGVAPAVEFISLKIASAFNGVLDDVGFEENAMAAIDYLIRHPDLGVKLTNNSWGLLEAEPGNVPGGEPTDFDAANAMVEKASDSGITMVFSAGNDGPEPGTINLDPGGTPSAITVAAACKGDEEGQGGSCPAGEITEFSSRGTADGDGPQVDVSAPGDQILAPVSPSVLKALDQCPDSGELLYYCISGTSMAAPHVAGVVALMQEVNPKLTPAQAEACLETTAVDMLTAGVDIHSGYGMVDTKAALRCAYALNPTDDGGAGGGGPGGGTGNEDGDRDDDGSGAADDDDDRSLPATGPGTALTLLGSLALAAGLLLRRGRRAPSRYCSAQRSRTPRSAGPAPPADPRE